MRLFAAIKRFTKSHQWLEFDPSTKRLRIGITEHAQKEIGDIVFIEFPKPQTSFAKQKAFATIQTVKTAADIYTPCSCKVLRNNTAVENQNSLVNKEAQKAWLSQFSVQNESELEGYMTEQQYEAFIKQVK